MYLVILAFGVLWLPVLHALGAHWSTYEQYQYGWAVPFLCLYLLWRATEGRTTNGPLTTDAEQQALERWRNPGSQASRSGLAMLVIALAGLLMFPTRVLQEANPLWRLPSYALVLQAIVISLAMVCLIAGWPRVRSVAFPICFILVAVPWPTPLETAVVQSLTHLNTGTVLELTSLLGIAAVEHGNIIEVSTGMLGVDEACSGIRSTQAVLMLSLFFGEMYRHGLWRRVALVIGGLGIAVVLNVVRTTTLTVIAAHSGIAASNRWHDTTGLVVLVGCFCLVWVISRAGRSDEVSVTPPTAPEQARTEWAFSRLARPACVTVVALALVSVLGSELWFRAHEKTHFSEPELTLTLPQEKSGYREVTLTEDVISQLRYDTAQSATWRNSDGTRWQLFHFRWKPAESRADRVRVHLAKSHRPERCLPNAGRKLEREFEPLLVEVNGLTLPFRMYQFGETVERGTAMPGNLFVFFSVREDHTVAGKAGNMRESHSSRFAAALQGNRGLGQRSIELVVWGARDAVEAARLFRQEMASLTR